MNITSRQQEILDFLLPRHFASITELAKALYTSGATVRREIKKLEDMGILKSVYGGVMLAEYDKEPVPITLRDSDNSSKKEIIAAKAATLIRDNCTVIFDSSSTVRRLCKHIQNKKGITVITNNLRVCDELKNSNIKVVCTGGSLIKRRECFAGHFAEQFIKSVKADMLFFSSQGLSDNGDITDSSEEEIALRRVMFQSAKEKIFLCDSSKFNTVYPYVLCNIKDITKTVFDNNT